MKVQLLAYTRTLLSSDEVLSQNVDYDVDYLSELAGRACYESFSRPNPATASNDAYLANILAQGHYSVLEHSSATFYVTGVSRTLTHELVRHRHLSYSQRSQRYVDESQSGFVTPAALERYPALGMALEEHHKRSQALYAHIYHELKRDGVVTKEARGAARAALINATHTGIVVSGNMRAWRDFLSKRLHPSAEIEIRTLATAICIQLQHIAPSTFQDFDVSARTGFAASVDDAKGE